MPHGSMVPVREGITTAPVALPERLTGEVLRGLIRQQVETQSWVFTDGFTANDRLGLDGFRHA